MPGAQQAALCVAHFGPHRTTVQYSDRADKKQAKPLRRPEKRLQKRSNLVGSALGSLIATTQAAIQVRGRTRARWSRIGTANRSNTTNRTPPHTSGPPFACKTPVDGGRTTEYIVGRRCIFALDYCSAFRLYGVFPQPEPFNRTNRRLQTSVLDLTL